MMLHNPKVDLVNINASIFPQDIEWKQKSDINQGLCHNSITIKGYAITLLQINDR